MMVADKAYNTAERSIPQVRRVCVRIMHLRHAKSSDLPFLTSLLANNECLCTLGKEKNREDWVSIGQTYVNGVLKTELASWENCATRYSDASSALWVLEDTGKADGSAPVVGCIGCIAKDSEVELVRMYVDPNYRRRGLGRQLFDHLHMHACGIGAKRIHLSTPSVNEPGLAFYRSLGFVTANTFVDDFAPHVAAFSLGKAHCQRRTPAERFGERSASVLCLPMRHHGCRKNAIMLRLGLPVSRPCKLQRRRSLRADGTRSAACWVRRATAIGISSPER